MGDEAYDRSGSFDIGRKRGHQIAVVVKGYLLQSHLLKDSLEITGELHLSGSRRGHVGRVVALSVESDEIEEAFGKIHGSCMLCSYPPAFLIAD